MTRRPTRLIRLAQQLATSLGIDIDQDSDVMSEEDLRELLNAAIDYVEQAEVYRQQQISRPNIIGTTTSQPYTWSLPGRYYTSSSPSFHSHTFSDENFVATVSES